MPVAKNLLGQTFEMLRKDNGYDNAPTESFWGTLKSELVYHRRYPTREQVRREISAYIDIFYHLNGAFTTGQSRVGGVHTTVLSPAAGSMMLQLRVPTIDDRGQYSYS